MAEDAEPRYEGSKASKVLSRPREDEGKCLKDSLRLGRYDCGGLKVGGSLSFLQYSSDGVPHNLKIL